MSSRCGASWESALDPKRLAAYRLLCRKPPADGNLAPHEAAARDAFSEAKLPLGVGPDVPGFEEIVDEFRRRRQQVTWARHLLFPTDGPDPPACSEARPNPVPGARDAAFLVDLHRPSKARMQVLFLMHDEHLGAEPPEQEDVLEDDESVEAEEPEAVEAPEAAAEPPAGPVPPEPPPDDWALELSLHVAGALHQGTCSEAFDLAWQALGAAGEVLARVRAGWSSRTEAAEDRMRGDLVETSRRVFLWVSHPREDRDALGAGWVRAVRPGAEEGLRRAALRALHEIGEDVSARVKDAAELSQEEGRVDHGELEGC